MKYIIILAVAIFLLLFASSFAKAEQTNLKVRILPIDCLFEVIDAGTQQLRYLTPETCPIDEIPTLPEDPPISQETSNPITIRRSNYISDYYQEASNQLLTQGNIQPKVASAKQKRDVFDLIKSSKDIEVLLIVLLASFLALLVLKRIFRDKKI